MNPANVSILEVHNWRVATVQRQEGNSYSWLTILPKAGTRITLHPPQHGNATNTLIDLTLACLDALAELPPDELPPTTMTALVNAIDQKVDEITPGEPADAEHKAG